MRLVLRQLLRMLGELLVVLRQLLSLLLGEEILLA